MLHERAKRRLQVPRSVVRRVTSEGDLKRFQEFVHSFQQTDRRIGSGLYTRLAFENDDHISKISSHDEIVLHHEGGFLCVENETIKK